MEAKIIIVLIILLLIFLTGLWLKKSGKPYNNILVTIHKLLSVSAIIIIITIIYAIGKHDIFIQTDILLIVPSGLLLIVALISGTFLLIERFENKLFQVTHKTSSFLAIVCFGYTLYRLYLMLL